jgi:hypothetical protein
MNFIAAALIACTSRADESDGGAAAESAAFWLLCAAATTLFSGFFCESLSGAIAETEAIVRCVLPWPAVCTRSGGGTRCDAIKVRR